MDNTIINDFLKSRVELFADFPQDHLQQISAGSHLITFEPNEAVIEFGEQGNFLGILLEGEAEASITDENGLRKQLSILKTGDIFGEISLMTGDLTVADIIGISQCKALIIPQELFSSLLMTHGPAIKYLAKLIRDRIEKWNKDKSAMSGIQSIARRFEDPYRLQRLSDTPAGILVIDYRTSSMSYWFYDTEKPEQNAWGVIDNYNNSTIEHTFNFQGKTTSQTILDSDPGKAFNFMISSLVSSGITINRITAVGHRILHGGELFIEPVLLTEQVIEKIRSIGLEPEENPFDAKALQELMKLLPGAPHVALFDTAFHHTMPPYAYLYGLPYEYYQKDGIRRYGFQGLAHFYNALKAAEFLKRPYNGLEVISCFLDKEASMCAVDHGRCVDTSMGFSQGEGLIMEQRSGSLDPGILCRIMKSGNLSVKETSQLLNTKSGLLGMSGIPGGVALLEKAADSGNPAAMVALKSYCYSIRKYIGAYMAAMQGIDVIIFSGSTGTSSSNVRSLACQRLDYMGIRINEAKNIAAAYSTADVIDISADNTSVRVLVIRTDEQRMAARETIRTIQLSKTSSLIRKQEPMPVLIEVSAHHVHLSRAHIETLFGANYQLTPESWLSQPGQYACKEMVTLSGPKGKVERVRVLGPERKETQIEIAMTEQFKLGIHPPVRQSGDIENTPGITLEGPAGTVTTDKGVICALRHIHMAPEDSLKYGLSDKNVVRVRVDGDRELIFGDVLIRVHPDFRLAMHIDTDEANAANIKTGITGFIESVQSK